MNELTKGKLSLGGNRRNLYTGEKTCEVMWEK